MVKVVFLLMSSATTKRDEVEETNEVTNLKNDMNWYDGELCGGGQACCVAVCDATVRRRQASLLVTRITRK
jgi:hypothetical protein